MLAGLVVPFVKRKLLDTFSSDPYKTKTTTMSKYLDLYGGSDYIIDTKLASVLNLNFITMMYGVGMPILFPIAALNFFNQWVCERISVVYLMNLPPALDDKLNKSAMRMLRFSSVLLLFNGAWMLGNKQVFDNYFDFIPSS